MLAAMSDVALRDLRVRATFGDARTSIQVQWGEHAPRTLSSEQLHAWLADNRGRAFRVMRLILKARAFPGRWVRYADKTLQDVVLEDVSDAELPHAEAPHAP